MKKTKILLLIGLLTMILLVSGVNAYKGPFTEFRLTPDVSFTESEYGRSVAIDGDLVAVGAGGDGADGAVYLYKRQGMIYVFEEKLVDPDGTPESEFGRTVAIQGNKVIIGARFAQVGDQERAGAVYVFGKHGDFWQFEDKISSPSPEFEDNFGRALAIQGNLLVVTARKENQNANDVGAAYVFTYKNGEWKYQSKITAGDPVAKAYFGQSVALLGDRLVIGARNADPNAAGGFYLFQKSEDGWMEIAKVTPLEGQSDDQYGFTIVFSGDTIVVGARRADSGGLTNSGAVFVYTVKGDSVELVTRLTASDASEGDEFGQSVAIAGDVIAVGAWRDKIDDNGKQGSIYLFHRKGGQWIETDKIIASDGTTGDEFGYSLSAFGNLMVTGAHKAGSGVGAAYVLPLI
jgi:hypothetical protein